MRWTSRVWLKSQKWGPETWLGLDCSDTWFSDPLKTHWLLTFIFGSSGGRLSCLKTRCRSSSCSSSGADLLEVWGPSLTFLWWLMQFFCSFEKLFCYLCLWRLLFNDWHLISYYLGFILMQSCIPETWAWVCHKNMDLKTWRDLIWLERKWRLDLNLPLMTSSDKLEMDFFWEFFWDLRGRIFTYYIKYFTRWQLQADILVYKYSPFTISRRDLDLTFMTGDLR